MEDPKPESTPLSLMNAIKDISGFVFSPPMDKDEEAAPDVSSKNGDMNSVAVGSIKEEEVDEHFLKAAKRISNVESTRVIAKDIERTMEFLEVKEVDNEAG